MNRLHTGTFGVALASGANTLPFPPVAASHGLVTAWNDADIGAPPEFELELWATGARNLTDAKLFGAHLHNLVYADDTFTAAVNDVLTNAAHGLFTGDGPFQLTSSGTLPGGLSAGVDYYAIKLDDNTFSIATSRANALAGVVVDVTSTGSGTHTISDVVGSTMRVHWTAHGHIGLDGDGAVALTEQKSYSVRCRHTPRSFAYAVSATLDGGAGLVSVAAYPIFMR